MKAWTWIVAALLCAAPQGALAKVGLSSQFVDVVFENLKPGRTYNIRELRGVPYTIKNRGDAAVEVQVDAQTPEAKRMIEPYEPVPDPSWVRVAPNRMRVNPGAVGFGDVIISIPDDPALEGRHFQAMLWARTIDTGMLAAGVKSRIRFSIGPGPETLEKEARRKAMVQLNYDLWPSAFYVRGARAGKRYDVAKREGKSLKLTNRNSEALEVRLQAIPWPKNTVALPAGYEYVEKLDWVSFKPAKVKVKGNRVEDVRMVLEAPEELKGRKVAFLVQVSLPVGTPISATHQAFVTVADD